MTNENDSVKNKHLESTAAAVKRYVLSEISDVTNAVINDLATLTGGTVLSTTPATVDGGIWYETTSTAPIVKIYQGGSKYFLYTNQLVSPNLSLSSAAETITSGSSSTVTLSHSGNGVISLSNPNTSALAATYNSSTKVITLTNNLSSGDDPATVNVGISLSESGTYAADSKTLAVTCQVTLLDPQLTLSTYSSDTFPIDITVTYLGNGTVSVSPSTSQISASYNSSTHKITVSKTGNSVTGSVEIYLSAAGAYRASNATFNVFGFSDGGGIK